MPGRKRGGKKRKPISTTLLFLSQVFAAPARLGTLYRRRLRRWGYTVSIQYSTQVAEDDAPETRRNKVPRRG